MLLYRSFKLHLVLFPFLFDGVQASRKYKIVVLTLNYTYSIYDMSNITVYSIRLVFIVQAVTG